MTKTFATLAVVIETICIVILLVLIATPKQVFDHRVEIRFIER